MYTKTASLCITLPFLIINHEMQRKNPLNPGVLMKRPISDWSGLGVLLCLLFIVYSMESCTLPTDEDVVQWDFSLTVPAIQEQVHIVETLDSLTNETSDGETGDVIIEKDSLVRMVHIDTFETEFDLLPFFESVSAEEEESMGLLTLTGLGETIIPIAMQRNRFDLPKEIAFALPIESDLFQQLDFDVSSPNLPLTLQNLSPANTMNVVSIQLITNGVVTSTALSSQPIAPGTAGTVSLPLAEQSLIVGSSELFITITYSETISPSETSELRFSLDNSIIKSGLFNDALLPDIIEVPVSKKLADSLQLQHVNFQSITLQCNVENNLNMSASFNGIINQSTGTQTPLWQMAPQLDPGTQTVQSSLMSVTLMPFWDQAEAESYLDFTFQIAPVKTGSLYAFNATNSIAITLTLENMQFSAIQGSFPYGLEKNIDASEWELPQLFSMQNQQEILGKMFTEGATLQAEITTFQDLTSKLDSLELTINTNCGNILGSTLSDTLFQSFSQLKAGKVDTIRASMDAIINNFPNQLQGDLFVRIPNSAGFALSANGASLAIPVSVVNRMEIPLQYRITEPMAVLSEVHQIGIPNEQLQVVNKLDKPVLTLTVTIENNSPLELSLFGMGSGLADSTLLDNIENNQFGPGYIELTGQGDNLFYMTGNEQLTLSDSGSTATTTWQITGTALDNFIENDSLCTRFLVSMPAKEKAVISTESHISVKTAIAIDGLMSANKLIDEEEEENE